MVRPQSAYPPLRFMLRQEAERNKGNVNSGVAKVIRHGWKTVGRLSEKEDCKNSRGWNPCNPVWAISVGPLTSFRQAQTPQPKRLVSASRCRSRRPIGRCDVGARSHRENDVFAFLAVRFGDAEQHLVLVHPELSCFADRRAHRVLVVLGLNSIVHPTGLND